MHNLKFSSRWISNKQKSSKNMTLNNTVQDYLKTIEAESSGITCPACGSILGMKRQGSTEMVLTENARLELDGYWDLNEKSNQICLK
jgi:hypothetical protein